MIYFAFLVLEVAIGIYFPSMSTLKSVHIPESNRANIMNWFRVPMNTITCLVLLGTKIPFLAANKGYVFFFCFLMTLLGLVVVKRFINNVNSRYGQEPNFLGSFLFQTQSSNKVKNIPLTVTFYLN